MRCLSHALSGTLTLTPARAPGQLAAAGFFYVGGGEGNTLCQCYLCGKELEGWETKDVPLAEHTRRAPACPILALQLPANRRATFALADPAFLRGIDVAGAVAAGLYYAPDEDDAPAAACHACGCSLSARELAADPLCEGFPPSRLRVVAWC